MTTYTHHAFVRLPKRKRWPFAAVFILLIAGAAIFGYTNLLPHDSMKFDKSVTSSEQQTLAKIQPKQTDTIKVNTTVTPTKLTNVLAAYVFVTNPYAIRSSVSTPELSTKQLIIDASIDPKVQAELTRTLHPASTKISSITKSSLSLGDIAIIPANKLSPMFKLLSFDDAYYLDTFTSGAVFREAQYEQAETAPSQALTKESVLKVRVTGVTALTRLMMKKLDIVHDPNYFSAQIGDFLADADQTHVSNESSFVANCTYSNTVFCTKPEFIETLKASGVDFVELTGNHNNDFGSEANTATINQYHNLGWGTFGGGLNAAEAAKPYVINSKHSRVAFLGYNFADSPNGAPIATATNAGANSFDMAKVKADIARAKQSNDTVIVHVQFNECYAYPAGYTAYPICYEPVANQTATFRSIIDLGADMVVGTQAHQPQTYELYNGKPIYYGLGNLYFEQVQWPGTEQGMILTHYFHDGQLLQTRISPTVYDTAMQTRLMTNEEATTFLDSLSTARTHAGL